MASFGDGATGTGAFHEAVNLAALWHLPVVFCCQNNRYAEMTPTAHAQPVENVADRAPGYAIPGVTVDGNDPDGTHLALDRAVRRARSGGGPTLVECTTFRLHGHYFGDPMRYLPKAELEAARAAEPLARYRNRLLDEGVLDAAEVAELEQQAAEQVEEAFTAALAADPPAAGDAGRYVYADPAGVPA